jgi:hypothetical protein
LKVLPEPTTSVALDATFNIGVDSAKLLSLTNSVPSVADTLPEMDECEMDTLPEAPVLFTVSESVLTSTQPERLSTPSVLVTSASGRDPVRRRPVDCLLLLTLTPESESEPPALTVAKAWSVFTSMTTCLEALLAGEMSVMETFLLPTWMGVVTLYFCSGSS